jgi:hypothetical protein
MMLTRLLLPALVLTLLALGTGSTPAFAADDAPVSMGKGHRLQIFAEQMDREGKTFVAPAALGDLPYLAALLETTAGKEVSGATVQVKLPSGVQLVQAPKKTDDMGYVNFVVLAKNEGDHVIGVGAKGLTVNLTLRVAPPMSRERLEGLGITNIPDNKGTLNWKTLTQARLEFADGRVSARFDPAVQKLNGSQVRLMGFMVPLDAGDTQKHFLLSASPPFCYFHMPGGPTTIVEVFAKKDVAFVDDPIILTGRLKTLPASNMGVLYQLLDAH